MITNASSGTNLHEIAPGIYRINTPIDIPGGPGGFNFNQYLVADDEPLLFHTGPRRLFPLVAEAIGRVLPLKGLRYVAFSHFEADECGALNDWLEVAPHAQAACGLVTAMVSVNDLASRPARPLADGEVLGTGKRRFRYVATPHLPHGWDAGHLFEETDEVLLCSDLFHQMGNVEPMTDGDLVGRYAETLAGMEASLMAGYVPYGKHTERGIARLAALAPKILLPMHGSAFRGDGARSLRDMGLMLSETLG